MCEQSIVKFGEIVGRVSKAEECERGEVYVIICMAIIQLPYSKITYLLPKDYAMCI